jgi:hypothetical protein
LYTYACGGTVVQNESVHIACMLAAGTCASHDYFHDHVGQLLAAMQSIREEYSLNAGMRKHEEAPELQHVSILFYVYHSI